MKITKATNQHLNDIKELLYDLLSKFGYTDSFEKVYECIASRIGTEPVYVALVKDQVIGFVSGFYQVQHPASKYSELTTGYIDYLIVKQDYVLNAIGKKLMQRIENDIYQHADLILLHAGNIELAQYYVNLGYKHNFQMFKYKK